MAVFRVGGQIPKIHTVAIINSILPVAFPDHWLSHIQCMSPEPMLSSFALLSVQTLSSVLQVLHRWVLKERYTGDAIGRRPMLAGVHCKSWTQQCHSPVSRQVVMFTQIPRWGGDGLSYTECHFQDATIIQLWLACTNTAYQNRLTITVCIMRFIAAYTPPHCVSCA